MTKIIITGGNGQLGRELQATSPENPDFDVIAFNRSELDICSADDLAKLHSLAPDIVINASAYTQVDVAESEPDKADAVNHKGIADLANVCRQLDSRLIHISTDFVFDGAKPAPYTPEDTPNPQSAYGRSKLLGEQAISAIPGLNYATIRTSWVYSANGGNFVKTMLRLFAERPSLNVVYDQAGSPTWAKNLARSCWTIAASDATGIYHCSDSGVTSWYDFAVAIYEEATLLGLLDKPCDIKPILTAGYPTPARRPHYSVLDCSSLEATFDIERHHWRSSLREMLRELT